MKNVDWKKVAVTAAAIGVGIALTVATGGLGAPVAMAIGGAASGAIISGYDAYSSGQRGWELVGSIVKGAGTGAISGFIGGQFVGAGASLATNVTQSISNQAVRQVAKIGVESAVETAIDTGIDLATGNKITGQTVAMNFAFNTFTNGAGSVSPKKAPKADVVTTKPKSGDVAVTRPRKDVTPVQQLALPGPTSKPLALPAPKTTAKSDFYVAPDGRTLPSTAYRYMDSKYAEQTMRTMEAPGSYIGLSKFDSASKVQDAYQISPAWNNAKLRGEFDTLQIMDNVYVPKEAGDMGKVLEPITRYYPEYGKGGYPQLKTNSVIEFKKVDIIGD